MVHDGLEMSRKMVHYMVRKGYLVETNVCNGSIGYSLGEEPPAGDEEAYAIWQEMKSLEGCG